MLDRVVLHYCGQNQDMGYDGIRAGQADKVWDVSKPTALKRLRTLVEKGLMFERTKHWRGDAVVKIFVLSPKAMKMYKGNQFRPAYIAFLKMPDEHSYQSKLF